MKSAIYIDDTGSPGQKTNSKYLKEDRKTWVAVILDGQQRVELETLVKGCLSIVAQQFGVSEFHFTDMYMGRNEYKNISYDDRMYIFSAVAEIFRRANPPIIVQTINGDSLLERGIIIDSRLKANNFVLNNNSDLALMLLLKKCKEFIIKNRSRYGDSIDIIVDEGRQKKDTYQEIDFLDNIATGSRIEYRASNQYVLLQLADYVAFSINRSQIIATKNEKKHSDYQLMEIINHANFNVINLKKSVITTPADYDKQMREDKDSKGLPSDTEMNKRRECANSLRKNLRNK